MYVAIHPLMPAHLNDDIPRRSIYSCGIPCLLTTTMRSIQLEIDPATETLTGRLLPGYPIVDAHLKAHLLRTIAAENGIPLKQVLSIGDGANDLLMLKAAGLGVAVNAKSRVQLEVCSLASYVHQRKANEFVQAPTRLNTASLLDILYILGFTRAEQDALLADDQVCC